jgi:hypothetical protein
MSFRDVFLLCNQLQLQVVEVELDAKVVVDLLSQNSRSNNYNTSLLDACRELLGWISLTRVKHCFREANKCAHAFARRREKLQQDSMFFENPYSDALIFVKFTGCVDIAIAMMLSFDYM